MGSRWTAHESIEAGQALYMISKETNILIDPIEKNWIRDKHTGSATL
jgi:hypothetical protein